MDFVSIDMWTIIFQWCNLFILFFLIKKFLFRPVEKILKAREDEIYERYQKADKMNREAAQLKSRYQGKIMDSRQEAEQLITASLETARHRSAQIIKEAEGKAEEMLRQAKQEIRLEKKHVIGAVKKDISDMAVEIAGKVIEKDLKKEDHEELIQKLICEMGEAS